MGPKKLDDQQIRRVVQKRKLTTYVLPLPPPTTPLPDLVWASTERNKESEKKIHFNVIFYLLYNPL